MTQIRTVDILPDLGFSRDDASDTFRLELEDGTIQAVELLHPRSGYVVSFSGVLRTTRTLSEVDFAMPRLVESIDQAKAWIAFGLKDAVGQSNQPNWLAEGRDLRHLLPWVQDAARSAPRLQCIVDREQFRPMASRLRNGVFASDFPTVELSFRDSILRIQLGQEVFAIAGHGNDWPSTLTLPAASFASPQRRLQNPAVYITVRGDTLNFGTLSIDIAAEHP